MCRRRIRIDCSHFCAWAFSVGFRTKMYFQCSLVLAVSVGFQDDEVHATSSIDHVFANMHSHMRPRTHSL
jgi:hypothetical protein